jgi:hypothetical protein
LDGFIFEEVEFLKVKQMNYGKQMQQTKVDEGEVITAVNIHRDEVEVNIHRNH